MPNLAAKTHNKENNIQIIAAEPAKELSQLSQKNTQGLNVKWVNDSLPALSNFTKQVVSFDLILLSAFWMLIPQSHRSICKLANLLKPDGKLVISLRHGQTKEECKQRKMHHVCADELKRLATDVGLFTKFETIKENDKLGRNRFVQLKQILPKNEQITCVWSAKSLTQKFDIDHSMPFARWPNNDLWNLLPTDSQINNQKSDRLPTEKKLKSAKERIQHWWQVAWLSNVDEPSALLINNQSQRFFAEANAFGQG